MEKDKAASRPNIVMIMADQLAAASLHCYGSGVPSTPVLDQLAARGVRFDRCYASATVCAPSRATFLTGRSPEIHGVTDNNLLLTTDTPTYAHVLGASGYRSGGFGKFHQTPMQQPLPSNFAYLGFTESVATEDTKLGPWLDWIAQEHPGHYETALAVAWQMNYLNRYGEAQIDLVQSKFAAEMRIVKPLRDQSEWQIMYPSPLPKELHQTTYITDLGIDFMRRHTEQHPEEPFFCKISYVDPHDPYSPPAPYDTMFAPDDMPLPVRASTSKYDSEWLEASKDFHGFREIIGNEPAIRRLRALYHGSLKFMDDQIGRIVKFLEEQGLFENTIVVFTTDHGEMLGDHDLITKGNMFYDKAIRCPLIVCGSGVRRGETVDRLTCSLDFFPTFCDWAGMTERPPQEGKSFAEACGSSEYGGGWHEIIVESLAQRCLITSDGWRLTISDEERGHQMFHLQEDPDEQRNLFEDPERADAKERLMIRLFRALMRPKQTQQYRNLPQADGMRCLVKDFELVHCCQNFKGENE